MIRILVKSRRSVSVKYIILAITSIMFGATSVWTLGLFKPIVVAHIVFIGTVALVAGLASTWSA